MSVSDAVTLVAAAAGAFLGSGSAFLLESRRRKRAESDARQAAVVQAQFALSMQMDTLVNIRNQYLSEVRDEPNRFMLLVPFQAEPSDPIVELADLGFIALVDDMEVLHRLHKAQSAYLNAMSSLRARNDMMDVVYAAARPHDDFDFSTGAETVSLDGRLARRLKGITDGLYSAVDSGIELEGEAVSLLAQVGTKLYPKGKFYAVDEVPEPASSEQALQPDAPDVDA